MVMNNYMAARVSIVLIDSPIPIVIRFAVGSVRCPTGEPVSEFTGSDWATCLAHDSAIATPVEPAYPAIEFIVASTYESITEKMGTVVFQVFPTIALTSVAIESVSKRPTNDLCLAGPCWLGLNNGRYRLRFFFFFIGVTLTTYPVAFDLFLNQLALLLHDRVSHMICLLLISVAWLAKGELGLYILIVLLHNMGQFMCQ